MRYIAFIHKEEDSVFGVSFPDFPGCISAGDSLDEALLNASEALQGHVQMMEADGDHVPSPRSADDIMKDKSLADEREGAIISAVPLVRDRGSTTRIMCLLIWDYLKQLMMRHGRANKHALHFWHQPRGASWWNRSAAKIKQLVQFIDELKSIS